MHYSLKGGTIAVLSVMERPFFFAGAIFSAPSIKVDANPCTVYNLLLHLLQIINENTMQRLFLFLGVPSMQKQDTANPKQKNTTRKQKYKSQNRNKHLKAETRTKKYKTEPQN